MIRNSQQTRICHQDQLKCLPQSHKTQGFTPGKFLSEFVYNFPGIFPFQEKCKRELALEIEKSSERKVMAIRDFVKILLN